MQSIKWLQIESVGLPSTLCLSRQRLIDVYFQAPSFLVLLGLFFYLPPTLKIFLSVIFPLKHCSALCLIMEHFTWWPCISSKSSPSRKHLFHSMFPLVMLLITALFLQLPLISRLSQESLDNVMRNYHWKCCPF